MKPFARARARPGGLRVLSTCTAVVAASVTASAPLAAGTAARVPLLCTRGASGQQHVVTVSTPGSVAPGATYTVRLDHVSSGQISHTGLNYIFDMETDYLLPAGGAYVPGSARVVPGTGSANVAGSARVSHSGGVLRLVLPGHVASGSSYTAPSVEVQVQAGATAGAVLPIAFSQLRVKANAFLVGDVSTTCEPSPKPYVLARTRVVATESPAP